MALEAGRAGPTRGFLRLLFLPLTVLAPCYAVIIPNISGRLPPCAKALNGDSNPLFVIFAAFPLLGFVLSPALLTADGEGTDTPVEERLCFAQKRIVPQGTPRSGVDAQPLNLRG